jgi:hypothetical protein
MTFHDSANQAIEAKRHQRPAGRAHFVPFPVQKYILPLESKPPESTGKKVRHASFYAGVLDNVQDCLVELSLFAEVKPDVFVRKDQMR